MRRHDIRIEGPRGGGGGGEGTLSGVLSSTSSFHLMRSSIATTSELYRSCNSLSINLHQSHQNPVSHTPTEHLCRDPIPYLPDLIVFLRLMGNFRWDEGIGQPCLEFPMLEYQFWNCQDCSKDTHLRQLFVIRSFECGVLTP